MSALNWNFDNSYLQLPEKFYTKIAPVSVKDPSLFLFNDRLAEDLGLKKSDADESALAALFAGCEIPDNTEPLAQAYGGHQFGHFTMLGDGRAVLLGEHLTKDQKRFDIQFKGSGRTRYSRGGDGRATLYSMLREYLISEAMHRLGIPTSRSLAVATTGEDVYRETMHPGAVLTRVMSSHIRVGTFEFAIRFTSKEALKKLLNYTVDRHDPDLSDKPDSEQALGLLKRVCERQASLITEWMRVGFIHGVMNTDNTGIPGETFDYGPCAFMNAYDPQTVFSSIDALGRYSFGNQPRIGQWNMAVLAGSLVPLISEDAEEAKEAAQEVVNSFADTFTGKWNRMMASKIGFPETGDPQKKLVETLLEWMKTRKADYTNTFRMLASDADPEGTVYNSSSFREWKSDWESALGDAGISFADAAERMNRVNPAVIPRNHLVENALESAANDKNMAPFNSLLEQLENPYPGKTDPEVLQDVPVKYDMHYRTYCGT